MDTSETYIKMCEKAEEIQTETFRCLMPDDYVAYRHVMPEMRGKHMVSTIWQVERGSLTTETYSVKFIWLPRQGQLQEMYRQDGETDLEIMADFSYGILEQSDRYGGILRFNSMEQLWLAFCMSELHQKKWNGSEWDGKA